MQVRVLFFGVLKDLAGRGSEELTLPEAATVSDVIEVYERRVTSLRSMLPSIAISVNQEYSGPETRLQPGDEVALLPPVSGGSERELGSDPGPFNRITRDVIDTDAVLQDLKQPEDGAAVVFEGIVRNNTRGRRTLFLEYEAYEDMALKQLDAIVSQARARFQIRDVALIHRLGRLDVGETNAA